MVAIKRFAAQAQAILAQLPMKIPELQLDIQKDILRHLPICTVTSLNIFTQTDLVKPIKKNGRIIQP